MIKTANQCFRCRHNLGGFYCAVHGSIKLHKECEDFQEFLIRFYTKRI